MPGTSPVHLPHLDLKGGDVDDLNTLLTGPVVTVTGARDGTPYGEYVAASFATDLAKAGVTLLVGANYGIEAAAARAHTAAGGRVILVHGGGIDRAPLDAFGHLPDRVLQTGGMLAALAPRGTHLNRELARRRATTMAQVTGAVVVVEAATKSLPLAMADTAAERGVPVFAVPGPVTSLGSEGPHHLIATGRACLAARVGDLGDLDALTGRPVTTD